MDKESQDDNFDEQFQYKGAQQVQLNKMVKCLLLQSHHGRNLLPGSIVKKICELYGLQCGDETFYKLLANMVDFKLTELLSMRQKKDSKQSILKTSELQTALESVDLYICKPRIIPEISLEQTTNNLQLPHE